MYLYNYLSIYLLPEPLRPLTAAHVVAAAPAIQVGVVARPPTQTREPPSASSLQGIN